MKYRQRLIDKDLDLRSQAFAAINIVGPKGCGKTTTAEQRVKTAIKFQHISLGKAYVKMVEDDPAMLFTKEKPILFDEWQDAPKIWDAVRYMADQSETFGQYYLTGSSAKKVKTKHTGTGRISTVKMLTMSTQEYGDSNGSVSLSSLFKDPSYHLSGQTPSSNSLADIAYIACRGGYPKTLGIKNKDAALLVANDYYLQTCNKDITTLDNVTRRSEWTDAILKSYARNCATTVTNATLYEDVKATTGISKKTHETYVSALKRLYILDEISAFYPNIRSRKATRGAKKKIFLEPSLACAALGIGPSFFLDDYDLFGHIFENLVLRDLLIYAEAIGGKLKHYRDESGLEIDAVIELKNGNYALIEIKIGNNRIEEAEKSLLKFRDLVRKHNENRGSHAIYKEPSLMIVITANSPAAYETKSGVKVIPFLALGI